MWPQWWVTGYMSFSVWMREWVSEWVRKVQNMLWNISWRQIVKKHKWRIDGLFVWLSCTVCFHICIKIACLKPDEDRLAFQICEVVMGYMKYEICYMKYMFYVLWNMSWRQIGFTNVGGIDGLWGGAQAPCSSQPSANSSPHSFHQCDQCEKIFSYTNGLKIHDQKIH